MKTIRRGRRKNKRESEKELKRKCWRPRLETESVQ